MNPLDGQKLDVDLEDAITRNHLEMVNRILRIGVNLELRNERDENALHVAAAHGNPAIVELILKKGVDIDALGSEEHGSALHLAVSNNHVGAAKVLIGARANVNIQDDLGDTALHLAASAKSMQLIKTLLKHGADPNIMNESRDSPFHLISNSDSFSWELHNYYDLKHLYNVFLNYGLDVNLKDEFGENALHSASMLSTATVVRRILKMNVNVNERSDDGSVPLHYAARNECQIEARRIVKELVKSGADINARDESNQTPFVISIMERRHEVTKYLINQANFDRATYGFDPLYLAITATSCCTIHLLAKHGYRPDSAKYGILAAKGGHIETMNALLSNGMKIDDADSEQRLSILTSALYADNDYNRYMVEFLLRKGADINYEKEGWIPVSRVWEDPPKDLIVLYTLLKHVALLVAQNKFVHQLHLNLIKANDGLRYKFDVYTLELSGMKNTHVWEGVSSVTYFDLLVLRNDALTKYLRSKEIRAMLESCPQKNLCKEYRDELESNVDEGIHRLQAVRMWEDMLHKIFRDLLPFEITCKIATYMLHFFRYTRYVNHKGRSNTYTCTRY